MSTLAPPFVITGPVPQAPPYGLLESVEVDAPLDVHALGGVVVDTYPIGTPLAFNPCSTGTFRIKEEGDVPPYPPFGSFTLYLPSAECTAASIGRIGGWEKAKERLRRAFEARESFGVEREFSHGIVQPGNPYLAKPTGDDGETDGFVSTLVLLNSGTAVGLLEAFQRLEKAIGATGQRGVIHATPEVVAGWDSLMLLDKVSGKLRSINGTLVVSGGGYQGADPVSGGWNPEDPAHEDESWAFATGPVQVFRDEIEIISEDIASSMDHAQNSVIFRAERNYVVDWDTTLWASVLVEW